MTQSPDNADRTRLATPPQPWRRQMIGREHESRHRASTNLELLFDLTFVVAVAQAAHALAEHLIEGRVGAGVEGYFSVFFALWWAWVNFTWFASAFDTDDVPYRLLTLLQMSGVLVLAAGVPDAFDGNFTAVTLGYVVMRVAMIAQWLRAAGSDPQSRLTCLRYAAGIAVVQVGWVSRLALPPGLRWASFLLLVLAEIAVPYWAERPGMTSWHPAHIAERYGLFTIIVLGECVLAANVALQVVVEDTGCGGSTSRASPGTRCANARSSRSSGVTAITWCSPRPRGWPRASTWPLPPSTTGPAPRTACTCRTW